MSESLGEALPREMARVRDEVLPEYLKIPSGIFAAGLMRASLDAAATAMIRGDLPGMIAAYNDLKRLRAMTLRQRFACWRGYHDPISVSIGGLDAKTAHAGQVCSLCRRFLGYGTSWPPLPAPWPKPPSNLTGTTTGLPAGECDVPMPKVEPPKAESLSYIRIETTSNGVTLRVPREESHLLPQAVRDGRGTHPMRMLLKERYADYGQVAGYYPAPQPGIGGIAFARRNRSAIFFASWPDGSTVRIEENAPAGGVVDEDLFVRRLVASLKGCAPLRAIGYDRWTSAHLVQALNGRRLPLVAIRPRAAWKETGAPEEVLLALAVSLEEAR